MNVSVMKWLLANRSVLLECVELAKAWKDTLPYVQKWEIVDKIARKVIPLVEPAKAKALWLDIPQEQEESYPAVCMSLGAECYALGVDWKLIVDVIIPIIITILQALASKPGG